MHIILVAQPAKIIINKQFFWIIIIFFKFFNEEIIFFISEIETPFVIKKSKIKEQIKI